MPRPHANDLAAATYNLSLLYSRHHPRDNPRQSSGVQDIADIMWLILKVQADIRESEQAAPFGPGVEGGVRTLPRGSGHTDIDARTHDPLRKAQERFLRDLIMRLGSFRDREFQEYENLVGRQGVGTVAG